MISFREWLTRNDIYLDLRLSLDDSRGSLRVVALDSIPPHQTVARIPHSCILSRRTSTLSKRIVSLSNLAQDLEALSPPLHLAVHVLYELTLVSSSRWSGYFQHCPPETVEIGLLWELDGPARRWASGTDLERELDRIQIDKRILSRIFDSLVLPLLSSLHGIFPSPLPLPTLSTFLYSYSLVSSRSFEIDNYHRLSLVPLSDAFNHLSPGENQVEFLSGEGEGGWVCPECGKVEECRHDRNEEREQTDDEVVEEQFCEMVTTEALIEEGEEVFNSYGERSNARLVAEYGFRLEANEWDRITFEEEEIEEVLRSLSVGRRQDQTVFEKEESGDEEDQEEDHPLIASPRSPQDTKAFYFDADAKISGHLWSTVVTSVPPPSLTKTRLREEDLSLELARIIDELDKEEGAEDYSETHPIDETTRRALVGIARAIDILCERRLMKQYRPDRNGSELLDLAEVETDPSVKLAIEFTAGERLLLERVRENWRSIITTCRPRIDQQDEMARKQYKEEVYNTVSLKLAC